MNRVAQVIAPRTVSTLVKAARAYPQWKAQNSPSVKPWLYPEQNRLAPLNVSDVLCSSDIKILDKDETEEIDVPEDAPSVFADLSDCGSSIVDGENDVSDKTGVSDKQSVVIEDEIVPQSAPGNAPSLLFKSTWITIC